MHDLNLTLSLAGILSVIIFVFAYVFVILEEVTHMRKSKPVMMAAGLIWLLLGITFASAGLSDELHTHAVHMIAEYGELFLFLLVAITYVNSIEERRGFEVLRSKLVSRGLSYRQLFILTGVLGFFLSGILDNLTASLVMGAVIIALGKDSAKFVTVSLISLVVAANAGGAFTPFGDITTLMVWQKGVVEFFEFFALVVPSIINWVIPASIMYFAIPLGKPEPQAEQVKAKPGTLGVVVLFLCTIATAVSFKNFLHLPPAMGMMLGLSYLQMWAFYLKKKSQKTNDDDMFLDGFKQFERVEWDTLLFFFGIIFAVGGLGLFGYLAVASEYLYIGLGAVTANTIIGAASAILDNIPLMFAVLTMEPAMTHGEWLLITLTCGVGGSLLSIGSAAGVALMGQAKGAYTFFGHLKWTWAIALGYIASVYAHLIINADAMTGAVVTF
ncbi:MAG: Na+/H+ antiporter NhaD/arsenite permease-like protein [Paracoccaceae bacterium]|jgi:Na+/H+ antiporter NhaD/arsenite permease-like protein